MGNRLKTIIIILAIVPILILLAGIYKFNYTNDDIYVETNSGEILNVDELENTDELEINEILDSLEEIESSIIDFPSSEFSGNGTEPFWHFSASGSNLIFKFPSDSGPMNMENYTGGAITNSGTSVNFSASGVVLDLELMTCSDGMSDIVYTYKSHIVTVDKDYTGCANIN